MHKLFTQNGTHIERNNNNNFLIDKYCIKSIIIYSFFISLIIINRNTSATSVYLK